MEARAYERLYPDEAFEKTLETSTRRDGRPLGRARAGVRVRDGDERARVGARETRSDDRARGSASERGDAQGGGTERGVLRGPRDVRAAG